MYEDHHIARQTTLFGILSKCQSDTSCCSCVSDTGSGGGWLVLLRHAHVPAVAEMLVCTSSIMALGTSWWSPVQIPRYPVIVHLRILMAVSSGGMEGESDRTGV